jgi:hypothetical protein
MSREKIDRSLVQIVVRQFTLETLRGWVGMCPSSISSLMHRLGLTPGEARLRRCQEADRAEEAAFQDTMDSIMGEPTFHPCNPINLDETAVTVYGGRNVTWARRGADGVWIESADGSRNCLPDRCAR